MPMAIQYGIVRFGQIWCVISREGPQFGFPSRMAAVAAAGQLAKAHRGKGVLCDIIVQDDLGQFAPLPEGML